MLKQDLVFVGFIWVHIWSQRHQSAHERVCRVKHAEIIIYTEGEWKMSLSLASWSQWSSRRWTLSCYLLLTLAQWKLGLIYEFCECFCAPSVTGQTSSFELSCLVWISFGLWPTMLDLSITVYIGTVFVAPLCFILCSLLSAFIRMWAGWSLNSSQMWFQRQPRILGKNFLSFDAFVCFTVLFRLCLAYNFLWSSLVSIVLCRQFCTGEFRYSPAHDTFKPSNTLCLLCSGGGIVHTYSH